MRARLGLVAAGALLLCGCSMQEIEERTPIAAAALDVAEDGVQITAQTVSVSGEDTVPMTETRQVTADSLMQGLDRFGHAAFWITAETFVLSAEVAGQERVMQTIQTLSAEDSIRPSVRLCVARGTSGQALMDTEQEADALSTRMDQAVRDGQAVDVPLYQALDDSLTDGVDLVLPALALEKEAVRPAGSAVFSGGRQSGWLDEEETAVLALLRGDTDELSLYLEGDNRVLLTNASAAWRVAQQNGAVRAALTVTAQLPDSSDTRQEAASRQLRAQCEGMIAALQAYDSDALGLGRIWYRQQPKQYSAAVWDKQYTQLPVSVVVRLKPIQGGERE